jgi:hypothetical protein
MKRLCILSNLRSFFLLFPLFIFLNYSCEKLIINNIENANGGIIEPGKIKKLPDLPGYVTLKCDFHIHTTFSDGLMSPSGRIDEALNDGLDAIAITDHLQYGKNYISWQVAEQYAKDKDIIVIRGTEISNPMPEGHFNALFIYDATPVLKDSVWDSAVEVSKQGGLFIWNHPGMWQPDRKAKMAEIHRRLITNKMLHGIEIFNGFGEFYDNNNGYYPQVFNFCEHTNIALMANSDTHGRINEEFRNKRRPITLVFAKERSNDGIKEALFSGRTIAFFNNMLAGKEKFVKPFFFTCISYEYFDVQKSSDQNYSMLKISNKSDIPFNLINGSPGIQKSLVLNANSTSEILLDYNMKGFISYEIGNIMTGENECLKVEFELR